MGNKWNAVPRMDGPGWNVYENEHHLVAHVVWEEDARFIASAPELEAEVARLRAESEAVSEYAEANKRDCERLTLEVERLTWERDEVRDAVTAIRRAIPLDLLADGSNRSLADCVRAIVRDRDAADARARRRHPARNRGAFCGAGGGGGNCGPVHPRQQEPSDASAGREDCRRHPRGEGDEMSEKTCENCKFGDNIYLAYLWCEPSMIGWQQRPLTEVEKARREGKAEGLTIAAGIAKAHAKRLRANADWRGERQFRNNMERASEAESISADCLARAEEVEKCGG